MDIKSLIACCKTYAKTPSQLVHLDKLRIAIAYFEQKEKYPETNRFINHFVADEKISAAYMICIQNPSAIPQDSALFYMHLSQALVAAIEPILQSLWHNSEQESNVHYIRHPRLKPTSEMLMSFVKNYLHTPAIKRVG